MRKILWGVVSAIVAVAITTVAFRSFYAEPLTQQSEPSEHQAASLQLKIDAIQSAEANSGRRERQQMQVSESELESFLIYGMRDEIPARVEAVDVQLTEGAVAADTKLTFPENSTGNSMLDLLVAGTHTLFLKGRLEADNGMGRFQLEEVQVDGIPVPNILIETLIARYVKPRYPQVDLNEPFIMPWNIYGLRIAPGKATITY